MIDRVPSSYTVAESSRAIKWKRGLGATHAIFGTVGLISLFLPRGAFDSYGPSRSINYFAWLDDGPSAPEDMVGGFGSEGFLLIVAMLTVIGFAVTLALTSKEWARITTGVLGICLGFLALFDALVAVRTFSEGSFVSVGAGTMLVSISSTILILLGIVALLPLRRVRSSLNAHEFSGTASQRPRTVQWANNVRAALTVPAILGIISVFLPVLSTVGLFGVRTGNLYFFSPLVTDVSAGDDLVWVFSGVIILGAMTAVIAFARAMTRTHRTWARITAGIIGIVVGLCGMLGGFAMMFAYTQLHYMSAGSGMTVLAIASTVIFFTGIVALLPAPRVRT